MGLTLTQKRMVEKMLYDYPLLGVIIRNLELERDALREDIMYTTRHPLVSVSVKGHSVPDVTGNAVTRLEENQKLKAIERELSSLRRQKEQLELALAALSEEERKLVELFYFKKKGTWATTDALGVSERTFYRIKKHAIDKMARVLSAAFSLRNSAFFPTIRL